MVIGIDCSRAFVSERTGTENYSYFLLRELLQVPSEHRLRLYLRPSGRDPEEFIRQVKEQLPDTHNFDLVEIRQNRLWTQLGLAIELRKHPVDVLFVPAHTLPLLRPKSIKSVVTVHDLGYEYLPQYHQFPHKLWLTYFTEYAVHNADALIAVSEATKADLITKFNVDSTKVNVVYEGYVPRNIESADIQVILEKYALKKPYIIFVGTVQPRKNLERAIEAFALLKRDAQFQNLQFVIIGKKGWLSDDIYAAPAKHGVQDDVKFLGYVADAETQVLWQHAAMTFYATLFEGFGIPILDSQSIGVPVVTSNKKPFTEVGGNACVYVDPERVESMVEGMRQCLTDMDLRARLIHDGKQNSERFSWRKAAEETLRIIEELRIKN